MEEPMSSTDVCNFMIGIVWCSGEEVPHFFGGGDLFSKSWSTENWRQPATCDPYELVRLPAKLLKWNCEYSPNAKFVHWNVRLYIATSVIKILSEILYFCVYLRALNVMRWHPVHAGCLPTYSIPSLGEINAAGW
jgi:hypothetical protein